MIQSKNKTPAPHFECTICCKDAKESIRFRKIQCTSCEYVVCSTCQKTYGKLECMNCHVVFRNAYAIETLGMIFVTKTVKQNKLSELMMTQQEELKTIGPIVEWTKNMRVIQQNEKYGIRVYMDDEQSKKPTRITIQTTFPCGIHPCRGHIVVCDMDHHKGKCNVCNQFACILCRETYHGEKECNPDILESLKEIRENTRPCPKCKTYIHRTHGCNHMHCTNCNTHFNYVTGTMIHDSTNYHYRDALIQRQQPQPDAEECRISEENPRIPEDVIRAKIRDLLDYYSELSFSVKRNITILLDGLYNVPKAVRSLIQKEYNLDKIATYTRDKYDELQVKFVMNEITQKSWEQYVYKTYVKQLVSELISNILYIYLGNTDAFQSELYNYDYRQHSAGEFETFMNAMMENVDRLIDVANTAISDIRTDYEPTSSNQIMIRKLGESQKSFCSKQEINRSKPDLLIPKERSSDMIDIALYDYQTPHVERLETILKDTHFAIDLSPLGTGKTYTAAKVFQNNCHYKHLLSISPCSVRTKWAEVNDTYHLGLVQNLTYNQIAGRRGIHPSHGLLIRNDYKVEVVDENGVSRMMDKYVFTATNYLLQLIEDGLLLVIDEFQHLKNETAQTDACQTIITSIMDHYEISQNRILKQISNIETAPQSRVLLMSGSPIDKTDQAARLFRTLGIMRNPRIVSGYQHAGINEVIEYMYKKFPDNYYFEKTIPQVSSYAHGRGYLQQSYVCKHFMYQWLIHIIKPELTSCMNPTEILNSPFTLEKFNGFFECNNAEYQTKIDRAVSVLQEMANQIQTMRIAVRTPRAGSGASAGEEEGGATTSGTQPHQEIMRRITMCMMEIETAKIHTFYTLACKYLNDPTQPNKKVVIALNYNDSISELKTLLQEYNPLILNGSKTFTLRQTILKRFQTASNEHRLMIGNFTVMSTGIDLDDKHGDYPRVCLASPNCSTISIYQLGHRFLRGKETKSKSQIYMVYSRSKCERKITELLMRKSTVMKEVLSDQVDAGMILPCDYTTYVG